MENKSPFFSVVMATYNNAEFIAESIESVVKQSFKDWELIIVNDGSTDETDKICQRYSEEDERIVYIKKENTGAMHSRIVGMKRATGKYFLGLDSDDYFDIDCFETVYNQLLQEPRDLVIWGHSLFGGDIHRSIPIRRSYNDQNELLYDIILNTNHPLWNKAILREVVNMELVEDLPLNYSINLDYIMLTCMILNVRNAVSIDKSLYNVRVRDDSMSNTVSLRKIEDIGETAEYVIKLLTNNGIDIKYIEDALSISYYRMIIGRLRAYVKANGFKKDDFIKLSHQMCFLDSRKYLSMKYLSISEVLFMKIFYARLLR